MKTALLYVVIVIIVTACRDEFHQLTPGTDPPLAIGTKPTCKPPPIEKNIVGTWHFETVVPSGETIRTGNVTFNDQLRLIDPDSLYSNYIDTGSSIAKVVAKVYNTNASYFQLDNGYNGPIFRIDLVIADSRKEQWPMYVVSNECDKIVIHRVGSYNSSIKHGFILTR